MSYLFHILTKIEQSLKIRFYFKMGQYQKPNIKRMRKSQG